MKLSVIIVNYNVEYFLEQCLLSARKSLKDIPSELIVVDNASVDGSLEMLRSRFLDVKLIANKDNLGFSKANNQGIRIAQGEYVLLLNPDTLIEENTFKTCIDFMDAHPDAGGLGVQMLDGKGNFLPESKRGLPTPAVAFYKISGLSKLFPRSATFGRYHLGNLDKEKNHEVEILSGAYMMMRKSALDKVGLLDEDFFMYGEDIDLSYRLIKGGYTNHYLADARIIHYKGESTKKTSVNYVMVFYNAMRIFAKKHFSEQNAGLFNKLIEAAIYARAGLSLFKRFVSSAFHPLLDFSLIWLGLHLIRFYYEQYTGIELPSRFYEWAFPLYSFLWVLISFLSNSYEHPFQLRRVFRGVAYGTGLILIIYSLIPEELRFSRALILFGALWTLVLMIGTRTLIRYFSPDSRQADGKDRRFAVLGESDEYERIAELMKKMGIAEDQIFHVAITELHDKGSSHLNDLTQIMKVDEVVFCAKDLSAQQIMDQMSTLDGRRLDFKIATPESMFIIGSNSKDSSGDLLGVEMNAINKATNRRNKRLMDLAIATFVLIATPLLIWFQNSISGLLPNVFSVIRGKRSWVGYNPITVQEQRLPKIRKGVLYPNMGQNQDKEGIKKSNMLYAKDYDLWKDLHSLLENWRCLGDPERTVE
jgi:GT2 family glycosyltransferase